MEIMTSAGAAQADLAGPGLTEPGPAAGASVGPNVPASRPGRDGAATPAAVPAFLLVLTHGAGGGVAAPDLMATREAALRLGGAVAMVTQPYRAAGRRAPGSAVRQDEAWADVITALRDRVPAPVPLIQGGRSNGARVACRTAQAVGARAVLALAFPLHPPGHPERSRAGELAAAGVPVLVINGGRDPFGVPAASAAVQVVVLDGETHALSRRPEAAGEAAGSWLRGLSQG
ncbi:MAG: alpha/beta family hydrolase [Streptosporangiales bacterium]